MSYLFDYRDYRIGEIIYQENDESQYIYLIRNGLV